MEHQNLGIMNKFFDAYSKHNLEELSQVLAENATWVFPGQNPFSGTKTGVQEIVDFFDKMGEVMGKSNVKVESLITGANDDYIVECQHIQTNREDNITLDHHWCVLWRFENGKITEGKHFAENQYKADAFFNEILK
jgi:ketosteroid isomerase-like protein